MMLPDWHHLMIALQQTGLPSGGSTDSVMNPWSHIDAGAVIIAVLGGIRHIGKKLTTMHTDFLMVSVEHEELVLDWCERTGRNINALPTRTVAAADKKARAAWSVF